jgi:hypothetical protein
MIRTLFTASLLTTGLIAGSASAESVQFHATMNGGSEVPATTSKGVGEAMVTLDTVAKTIAYTVTYSGLTGPATAAHIHGPAMAGANAAVVVPFPTPASPIVGKATLTDAQMADLMAGKMYANVHTAENKGGEIRGQLVK